MMSGISGFGGMQSADMQAQMRSKMFNKADADGSGGIDFKEFQKAGESSPMAKLSGGKLSEADQKKTFEKLDADKDGALSASEMEAGAKEMMAKFQSTMQAFGNSGGGGGGQAAEVKSTIQQLLAQLENSYSKNASNVSRSSSQQFAAVGSRLSDPSPPARRARVLVRRQARRAIAPRHPPSRLAAAAAGWDWGWAADGHHPAAAH